MDVPLVLMLIHVGKEPPLIIIIIFLKNHRGGGPHLNIFLKFVTHRQTDYKGNYISTCSRDKR